MALHLPDVRSVATKWTSQAINRVLQAIDETSRSISGNPKGIRWDEVGTPEKEKKIEWRHEWKYIISAAEAVVIRSRLQAIMEPDPHAGPDGKYRVRSLYFDDWRDRALQEKLDGTDLREKFRIRYYNHDSSWMRLEKKYRKGNLGAKFSEEVDTSTVNRLLSAGDERLIEELYKLNYEKNESLLAELLYKMRLRGLRPKCIVDYTREPYLFEPGNVRVTLDYNLCTSWNPEDFLESQCDMIPVASRALMAGAIFRTEEYGDKNSAWAEAEIMREASQIDSYPQVSTYSQIGRHLSTAETLMHFGCPPLLLEVKWDDFLPEVVSRAVCASRLSATAFSKYAQCRAFR